MRLSGPAYIASAISVRTPSIAYETIWRRGLVLTDLAAAITKWRRSLVLTDLATAIKARNQANPSYAIREKVEPNCATRSALCQGNSHTRRLKQSAQSYKN